MLELIRPLNCLLAGLAVLIGAIVAGGGELPYVAGVAFAAAALISGAGNAVNDYFDKDIDAVNRPHRPIPSGMLSARTAVTLGSGLFGVGVVLAALINLPCLALAALNSAILVIYSAELKRRGLAGNLTIGYLVGSTFLFGGLAVSEISVVGILAIMAVLSTVGRELIKGIEDMRGDRKLGLRTFPLRYGAGKAAVLGRCHSHFSPALRARYLRLGLPRPRDPLDWSFHRRGRDHRAEPEAQGCWAGIARL